MQETKLYKGNCHCARNCFEVYLPEIKSAITCPCRLCVKKGYLWAFPQPDSFKVTRTGGDDTFTTYESASLLHEFCSTCGIGMTGTHTSGPLKGKLGINVRTLLGVNPFQLAAEETTAHTTEDGAVPEFSGDVPPQDDEHPKLYTGSCHCGLVSVAVATKPLPNTNVKEDNCSICVRTGLVGIYPLKPQVAIHGREETKDYTFGRAFNGTSFCRKCGVHVFLNVYGPPKEIVDKLPEAKREFVRKNLQIQPVNIRVLEGVEWEDLKIERSDEGTDGYNPS